jgi:hypothetical protein
MNANELIAQGKADGHYPVALDTSELITPSGLVARRQATIATYQDGSQRVVGENGGRYTALPIELWEAAQYAAEKAGAVAKRAGDLDDGRKIFAEYDLPSASGSGFEATFTMLDSFDGTTPHLGGSGFKRLFCSNQMAALARHGGFARVTHTASIEYLSCIMHQEISNAIASGVSLRKLYDAAKGLDLTRAAADAAFDALWPKAPDDAGKRAQTIAENKRNEARIAAALPINREGSSLATLWNAATYLTERDASGKPRQVRGNGSRDSSMLLGTMGKRLEAITETVATLIDVIRPDGTVEALEVAEALDIGASPSQVGSALLSSMLEDE